MNNLSTFQIISIGLSVVFLIAGVAVFAAFGGLLGGSRVGPVTIWGTIDSNIMSGLIGELRSQDKALEQVSYVQKDALTYNQGLLNAMAAGQGPDLFLVTQENLTSFEDKITPVPYAAVSQAQFMSSFVDEGSLFLSAQGALALPFVIDPLVMYWNRDLFAGAGLAQAPQYWNNLLDIAPKITSFSVGKVVSKSAVALGEWQNINNAKAILSTLFMQTGDPIVARDAEGRLVAMFGQTPAQASANPAESALRFYSEFANPGKVTYSWNASLKKSADVFTAGDLAIYFGYASEYAGIVARNPNLRFSVASVPQLQGNVTRITHGNIVGLAISRSAANRTGALAVAQSLTNQRTIAALATTLFLPPVRRDVSVDATNNAAMQVFVESSLIARGWLDPAPAQTDAMFKNMITSVISGANLPAGAVAEGSQELQLIISRQ